MEPPSQTTYPPAAVTAQPVATRMMNPRAPPPGESRQEAEVLRLRGGSCTAGCCCFSCTCCQGRCCCGRKPDVYVTQ
ncbi:hypothetical protein Q8F55_006171 [Vanrija albida]|uniref:Cysteine-rich transmembrane CYSTM domain-containing protein n=1 Tax=Vanrija albida TaxID=181172 RepID=A0ABR3PWE6_9TREE